MHHFSRSHFATWFNLRSSMIVPYLSAPNFHVHTPLHHSHRSPIMPKQPKGLKRSRKPSAKAVSSSSGSSSGGTGKPPKARRVVWSTERTEDLLDWLEEHPVERHKLFSDSTKDAKDEGRRKRVAKGSKSEFHKMIADAVFSVDKDSAVRDDYRANPINYVKSVDNYIIRYGVFFIRSFCLRSISGCEKNIASLTRSLERLGPDYNTKIYRRGAI
jgi:hypothetical protein